MSEDAARGQVAGGAAEVYESFFVPALFAQWPPVLLEAAGVAAGHRVLDVGCGTGIVAAAAAARVGRQGGVAALDPNEPMLEVARRRPDPVSWHSGVAEALPFDDEAFDRVLSAFALMFCTDRERAVGEMARVLSTGGAVAVATWCSADRSPGYATLVDLVGRGSSVRRRRPRSRRRSASANPPGSRASWPAPSTTYGWSSTRVWPASSPSRPGCTPTSGAGRWPAWSTTTPSTGW